MPDTTDTNPTPQEAPAAGPGPDDATTKLAAAEKELHNYKLVVADYENARKRLARDAEVQRKYAAEGLFRDLLIPPRQPDPGARRGQEGPATAARSRTGVSATANQLLDVFRRHGVHAHGVRTGDGVRPEPPRSDYPAADERLRPGAGGPGGPAGVPAPRPGTPPGRRGRRHRTPGRRIDRVSLKS